MRYSDEGNEVYDFEIQFINEKTGEQVTVSFRSTGFQGLSASHYKIGDKVAILYEPDHPTNFKISSAVEMERSGFHAVIVVVLFLGAFILILSARAVYLIYSGKLVLR